MPIQAHSFCMPFRTTGGRCSSRCRVGRLHDKRRCFMRNLDARGVVIVVDMLGVRVRVVWQPCHGALAQRRKQSLGAQSARRMALASRFSHVGWASG